MTRYTLTLNGREIAAHDTLDGIWKAALAYCGHMTLAAFTDRGYKISTDPS
jgi:hypothetical protein